jgi:hypothetical protein
MSAKEIRDRLKAEFGVKMPANATTEQLQARLDEVIAKANAGDDDSDPDIDSAIVSKSKEVVSAEPELVFYEITLHSSEKDGDGGVFVGVNGTQLVVPRDIPVVVPDFIYFALKQSREIKHVVSRDKESGEMVQRVIESPRYNIDATRVIENVA